MVVGEIDAVVVAWGSVTAPPGTVVTNATAAVVDGWVASAEMGVPSVAHADNRSPTTTAKKRERGMRIENS